MISDKDALAMKLENRFEKGTFVDVEDIFNIKGLMEQFGINKIDIVNGNAEYKISVPYPLPDRYGNRQEYKDVQIKLFLEKFYLTKVILFDNEDFEKLKHEDSRQLGVEKVDVELFWHVLQEVQKAREPEIDKLKFRVKNGPFEPAIEQILPFAGRSRILYHYFLKSIDYDIAHNFPEFMSYMDYWIGFSFVSGDILKELIMDEIFEYSASKLNNKPLIKKIISNAEYELWCSNGKSLKPKEFNNVVKNGRMLLSWDYVTFEDGKLNLYHPAQMNYTLRAPSMILQSPDFKAAYEDIKPFLEMQTLGVPVRVSNNSIVSTCGVPEILKMIEVLDTKSNNSVKGKSKFKVSHKTKSQAEIREIIKEKDSRYLDYLSQKHNPDYKIIYCPEDRTTSTNSLNEDSFIFTLAGNDKLIVIFENVNPGNATYVAIADKSHQRDVVKLISQYFASTEVNKRYNYKKLKELLGINVTNLQKLVHTDLAVWTKKIENLASQ